MTTLTLLNTLRQHGVRFQVCNGKLRVIIPRGVELMEAVKDEIRQRKVEILNRVRSRGVTAEDVAEVFPGAMEVEPEPQTPAVSWLRAKLSPGPQHIADLLPDWLGALDLPTGRNLDDLMDARWTLGVVAYVGKDERFWWRLPADKEQVH